MKNLNFPGLPRVLVIDDEDGIREGLRALLQAEGVAVETSSNAEDAVRRIERKSFDAIFLDLNLPGADGLSILPTLRQGSSPADVVVLTGYGTVANTVEAMRKGACDVIEKPFTQDRILSVLRRSLETRQLKNELTWLQDRVRELTATELVGLSPAIRQVQTRIDQVSHAPDTTVLVTGKSGTGKELVARCIHERSSRRHGPFVAINCAALTENLLEAELFGYEPGAFTGANREGKEGLFAVAAGGTLFLDEIGEMAKTLQAKLLRVLQERSFRRVGGVQDVGTDVRIVTSTNRDLRAEVDAGRFREDLFYRLNVMHLEVPSLAERPEDIPLLAHFFLDQIGRQMGKALSGFTEEAMETLCEYGWPGNVRELRNSIEHAAIVCPAGMIDEVHLPAFTGGAPDGSDTISRGSITLDYKDRSIRALEGQLVARVLEETAWNISKAAAVLGINRTTLYNKIRLHSLGRRPGTAKVTVS
ncbi:MAG: sigma-54-dependent Fis family transcriptional regulator [Planctomycetes bacterium]|nr:sigma-54-dependent Fis family transcriptional regulator [Planctomycetota bacterium]MCB9868990.1 sigma-54-dependent Fis family transcriptional regulator [Planctomycetota bacterium]MCB9887950.1 sigma-54-dependent Fis family transcriptional regulator [Planctomycetota bacterium]